MSATIYAEKTSHVDSSGAVSATGATSKRTEVPSWIPLDVASNFLAISKLHTRLLVRDGALESKILNECIQVKTDDVLKFRPGAKMTQEHFASDVAKVESLRMQVVDLYV